jgi:hypothetical protein
MNTSSIGVAPSELDETPDILPDTPDVPKPYRRFEKKRQAALAKKKQKAEEKAQILGMKEILTEDILGGEAFPSTKPVIATCFFVPIRYGLEFRYFYFLFYIFNFYKSLLVLAMYSYLILTILWLRKFY